MIQATDSAASASNPDNQQTYSLEKTQVPHMHLLHGRSGSDHGHMSVNPVEWCHAS